MITEEQVDERCMGNITCYKIVGACWEVAMMSLQEAMDDNQFDCWLSTYLHTYIQIIY